MAQIPFLVICAFFCFSAEAWADYASVSQKKVPVERLVANLEQMTKRNPKSPRPYVSLGRLYAMAWAKQEASLSARPEMRMGGKEPKLWVPFYGNETPRLPTEKGGSRFQPYLQKSISAFQTALEKNKQSFTAKLGLAWSLQAAGRMEDARRAYREVLEQAWPLENKMTRGNGMFWSIVMEAGRALIPLLDPKKDKAEIKRVQERVDKLASIPFPVSPVWVPLDDRPWKDHIDSNARVAFDLDGTGIGYWRWLKPSAAWLVYLPSGEPLRSGLDLIGQHTFRLFWENGFEVLSALDDDGDRQLTGSELNSLRLWQDRNQDGVSETAELLSLKQVGIRSLTAEVPQSHPLGWYHPKGILLETGDFRPLYDWLVTRAPTPPLPNRKSN